MEIFKYKDYDDYVNSQIEGNLKKIDRIKQKNIAYVQPETIAKIVKRKPESKNILCHGTRNAKEQLYFQKHLPEAFIIGSEISTNATEFPMTVEHDFNKVKDEWVGLFDIVYSNSFDHTITPLETLMVWRDQLNDNGTLFIEHTVSSQNHVSHRIDPLKIEKQELINMVGEAGMTIVEQFAAGKNKGYILVCEKNESIRNSNRES